MLVQLPDGTIADTNQPASPSASEIADWQNQRAQLANTFAGANAQYRAAQASTDQAYNAAQGDLTTKYARMREALPEPYAKRGVLNSGIYQEGLQNYAHDRAADAYKLASQYVAQSGQNSATAAQQYGNYVTGSEALQRSEFARRADLAASLRYMQTNG